MDALELIPLGASLVSDGLVQGTGGNLSYRENQRLLVTASGANLARLRPVDLVPLSYKGEPLAADSPARTSEWAMHVAAYQARAEARVVVHVHPRHAIALGLLGRGLPALTPDQYLHLGREVPLVPYVTPTTTELAQALRRALEWSPAALLQNHGVLVTAPTIEKAKMRVALLEEGCGIYLAALAAGHPRILTESEMERLDEVTGGRYRLDPA